MAARPARPPSRKAVKIPKATAPHDSQPRARPRVGASLTSPRPMPRGEMRARARKKAPTATAASSPRTRPAQVTKADAGQQQQAKHDREGGVGDAVGQQPGAGVDHGQDHADEGQGQVGGHRPAEADGDQPEGEQEPQHPHGQLDQRVPGTGWGPGRSGSARRAAASRPAAGCRGATGAPQAGQEGPGRTTDRPCGTRWMTTLANRPEGQPQQSGQDGGGERAHGRKGTATGPPGPAAVHSRRRFGGATGRSERLVVRCRDASRAGSPPGRR